MKKQDIKNELDKFEDSEWVEKYAHSNKEIIKALRDGNMHKTDMFDWIVEAVILFNKILNSEQPND